MLMLRLLRPTMTKSRALFYRLASKGSHEAAIYHDPALETWNAMRENIHVYYKFNLKKAVVAILLFTTVPYGMMYMFFKGTVNTILDTIDMI